MTSHHYVNADDGLQTRDSPRTSDFLDNNRDHDDNPRTSPSTTTPDVHRQSSSSIIINDKKMIAPPSTLNRNISGGSSNRNEDEDDNNKINNNNNSSSPNYQNFSKTQSPSSHVAPGDFDDSLLDNGGGNRPCFSCFNSRFVITRRMCKIITVVILLAFLLTIGFLGVLGGDMIAMIAMKSEMVLTSWKTQLFNIWQNGANMDIVIYRKYYFFNLTNPREVYYNRVAPDFRVIGPFTYRTNRVRPLWSIYWDVEDDVNFRYHAYQFWDEERSKDDVDGSQLYENHTITSLNMALFTATYRISKIPDFTEKILPDVTINKQDICLLVDIERIAAEHRALGPKGIFTQRTVKEWLWGFEDETLKMLHDGSKIIDYHVPVEFKLAFNDSLPAPGAISYRHGQVCPLANYEDGCNNTMNSDSASTSGRKWDPEGVQSPVEDIHNVGVMTKWAGNDRMWWFGATEGSENDDGCQQFRGTEGLFLGANTKREDIPEIFVDGVYRSVKLQFLRDSDVEGLPTYRFILNKQEVELGPDSKCYHLFHRGMILNLSQVAFAEGFITGKYMYPMNPEEKFFPHEVPYNPPYDVGMLNFTITDKVNKQPTHIQEILKTQATEETYNSYLDIHPLTGSTLQANSRLQINSFLKPIYMDGCDYSFSDMMPRTEEIVDPKNKSNVSYYTSYFPTTGFPVLLIDRVADAPMPIVEYLKTHVVTPLMWLKIVGYSCFGLFGIVLGVSIYVRQERRRQWRKLKEGNAVMSREREYLVGDE